MKKIITLLSIFITTSIFSQNNFEKGYIIDINDNKINCVIKNMDWRNNPTVFEYKLTDSSEIKKGTINTIKEFGILNKFKYNAFIIDIDEASNNKGNLGRESEMNFVSKKLFLKHLIGGDVNLYSYNSKNTICYFYSNSTQIIPKQLEFKKYLSFSERIGTDKIVTLNKFHKQLISIFDCEDISESMIKKIRYTKSSLSKIINKNNTCSQSSSVNYNTLSENRKSFRLNIRPSYRSSSLAIDNSVSTVQDVDFGKAQSFALGIELEYFLSFNNQKWAVIVEPTYQTYKQELTYNYLPNSSSNNITDVSIDYKSIELPIGIRHYIYLGEKHNLFLNASYLIDLNLSKKQIEFSSPSLTDLDLKTRTNLSFGIGYKYDGKYSIELRQNTKREILGGYAFFSSDFATTSLILGINIL